MRQWNGWGDPANAMPLPAAAAEQIEIWLGPSQPLMDVSLAEVCQRVPDSRIKTTDLPATLAPLVKTDAQIRVIHARGQSLPDWVAMRSGDYGCFPDAVALPNNSAEVAELLRTAIKLDWQLIPYGGGTSVVGHINPAPSTKPVVSLSLAHMQSLLHLDENNLLASFAAGVTGPALEAQLQARGFTLGHFPQSFELSTLGGWVASRSSGQQSLGYGRIEQLFAGGRVETLQGSLEIPAIPASSAGPDLREWVMGSEGRLGVITEVKVRVRPLPERESFHAFFLPNWQAGRQAMQALSQAKVPLSMLRLSNLRETHTQLLMAGHPQAMAWLEKYLAWRGVADEKCMLMLGVTGSSSLCRFALQQAKRLLRQQGAVAGPKLIGKKWQHARFRSPYLREKLWRLGYAVDTLETCTTWGRVDACMQGIEQSLKTALQATPEDAQEEAHVFTHLSHVYPQGSSIYTTYIYRMGTSYQQTLARWQRMKTAASEFIAKEQATISHQHGVGVDHAPYLIREKGALGLRCIDSLLTAFDPEQRLNPGKLLAASHLGGVSGGAGEDSPSTVRQVENPPQTEAKQPQSPRSSGLG